MLKYSNNEDKVYFIIILEKNISTWFHSDIIKNHLLPNVICSGVLEGKVWTHNLLEQRVSLRKDKREKLFFGEGQITKTDMMASNGVLHVTDRVNIPRSGKIMSKNLFYIHVQPNRIKTVKGTHNIYEKVEII